MEKTFGAMTPGPDFEAARTQATTPFFKLDIPLDTAGVNQMYDVSGDFLYIDPASTGTATLEVNNQYSDPEAPFLIQPGFAIQAIFKRLKLTWSAQPGKVLRILYSTGARIVPTNTGAITGTVSVVDGGRARTLAGQAFMRGGMIYPGAAVFGAFQIWNPAGSGKRVILETVSHTFTSSQEVRYGFANAALSLTWGNLTGKLDASGGSATEVRYENALGVAYVPTQHVHSAYIGANINISRNFTTPIVLTPGHGFVVYATIANSQQTTAFEITEEAYP